MYRIALLVSAIVLACARSAALAQLSEEASGQAAAQAGKLRDAFTHYLTAYRALSWGSDSKSRLEKEIIELVLKLDPRPAIPEEAERRMARGKTALKVAQNSSDYESAAKEFLEAINQAPWWADAHYNLAVVREKQNEYQKAIDSFKTYLLAAPAASDAKEVKAKIYELEYLMEKIDKAKSEEEREREARRRAEEQRQREEQQRREEAQRPERLAGTWRLGANFGIELVDSESEKYRYEVATEGTSIVITGITTVVGRDRYRDRKTFRGVLSNGEISGTVSIDNTGFNGGSIVTRPFRGAISDDGDTIRLVFSEVYPDPMEAGSPRKRTFVERSNRMALRR